MTTDLYVAVVAGCDGLDVPLADTGSSGRLEAVTPTHISRGIVFLFFFLFAVESDGQAAMQLTGFLTERQLVSCHLVLWLAGMRVQEKSRQVLLGSFFEHQLARRHGTGSVMCDLQQNIRSYVDPNLQSAFFQRLQTWDIDGVSQSGMLLSCS